MNGPALFPQLALADIGLQVVAPLLDGPDAVGLAGLAMLPTDSLPPPPPGFTFGRHAFQVDAASLSSGQALTSLAAPLTLTLSVDATELAAAGGDLHRVQLALHHTSGWLGLGCTTDDAARSLSCTAPSTGQFALVIAPPVGSTLDWDVPAGHAFKQANGFGGAGDLGYLVVDDADAAFWSEFQRLGGLDQVGYPISGRFSYGGYLTQAFQKLVLQWRPELGQAVPVNVLDDLEQRGSDAWLNASREIPRPALQSGDVGLPWEAVVARHAALLDAYPGLSQLYSSMPDAVDRFGLPVAIYDFGSVVSVRLQRGTLQLWEVDMPWAAAGTVVVGNGGDLGKEAGLWPLEAVAPIDVVQP